MHCMQKSGNKWLGAKVHRLGRQKHNRSLFQDTVFLHKGLILPSFMLLPKMWVHVQLKRIWTHTHICTSLPFFVSPLEIVGTWQARSSCWYSWKLICFLPSDACMATQLLVPPRKAVHNHSWVWGKDGIALFSSSYRLFEWFMIANLGK